MGSSRRLPPGSTAVRSRAGRLADRIEAMPKPLFAAAALVALALLAVAVLNAPDPEERVAEVAMLSDPYIDDPAEAPWVAEPVEVEVLEYGFGLIEHHGIERLSVGAVVRNPHPTAVAHLVLEVTATDAAGSPVSVELFRIDHVPPDSDALVGHMLAADPAAWAGAELALTVEEVNAQQALTGGSSAYFQDRFTVRETEPLLSPPGHRILYRIESGLDHVETTRLDVVFRDADGAIVGGVGGNDHVVDGADANGSISVPPGASVHHFNLRAEEIPEGADLSQTEIGPGGVRAGG